MDCLGAVTHLILLPTLEAVHRMSSDFSESDLSCLATRSCAGICSFVQPATVAVVSVSMACTASQIIPVKCSVVQRTWRVSNIARGQQMCMF